MINFGQFLLPAPPPAPAPRPVEESDIVDSSFDMLGRQMQLSRENARADQQMGLNERHANLQDKRQAEYQALQNREQSFRESQATSAQGEQRAKLVRELMDKYVHARSQEEAAMYRQQLSQVAPELNMGRMRGTSSPSVSGPKPNAAAATQDTPQQAPAADPYHGDWQRGYAGGGPAAPPPKTHLSSSEERDLNAMAATKPGGDTPISAGILPSQRSLSGAVPPLPEPGPAPTGGGAVSQMDTTDYGQIGKDYMAGGPSQSMLSGQTPVLQVPPEWLRQYMDAQNNSERGFLSEGDALNQ